MTDLPDVSDIVAKYGHLPRDLTERGIEACCEMLERAESLYDLRVIWEGISPRYQRSMKVQAIKNRLKKSFEI